MTQPRLLDASGFGAPVAGRVVVTVDVLAELRRAVNDDEMGAVIRVRLPGSREAIMVGADLPQRQVGARVTVGGYWAHHATRGAVFRVEDVLHLARPHETQATVAYLVANIVGLGRKRAARLVTVLGTNALETLMETPMAAATVIAGGSGVAIAHALTRWADEQRRDTAAQLLTTRLVTAGVRYGTVRRIVRFFSNAEAAAVATLRHPYRLVDVPGVGWDTADTIAQRLGVAVDAPARLAAACAVVLADAPTKGHTCLPRATLLTRAARLLRIAPSTPALVEAVALLVSDGHCVAVDDLLGAPAVIALEAELTDLLTGLACASRRLTPAENARAESVLAESGLAVAQRDAVTLALNHGVSVITGRPGAGKTTTLRAVITCATALQWRVQIVAPTGKAASRAAAVTGAAASTVHRLLARESVDAPAPLDVDLLVIDEASMCDLETATWLMRAVDVTRGTRVVWCGDADQLPSVGYGQVLADLIASAVLPVARLTQIFRQAAGSPIIVNAHRLLDGLPLQKPAVDGWRMVTVTGPVSTGIGVVLDEVARLRADGFSEDDIQVLSPMRRGPLGVEALNAALQGALNPDGVTGPYVGGGVRARVGDRVVATRNIYDLAMPVYNGEQGVVREVHRSGMVRVQFADRGVTLLGVHCLMMRLAWAMTVHRSQGSEYPAVILTYDHRAHARMLERHVLYTAITRAKAHLTMVGTPDALANTDLRPEAGRRHTTLARQLAALIPAISEAPHGS